jgi:nucleotide-binding universal stress UspA family protein
MKVLLPVDVLQPYEPIVNELQRLLPLKMADIKLFYVTKGASQFEKIVNLAGKTTGELDASLKQKAEGVLNSIAELIRPSGAHVTLEIVQGSPDDAILTAARQGNFDLVVIPVGHHELAHASVLGDTASHVVKNLVGSAIVLRPSAAAEKPLRKVLFGLDGSAQALKALRTFVEQFQVCERHIDLALVHVVSIVGVWKFISPVEFVASIEDNLNMVAETILADGEKVLDDYKIHPSEMFIRTGDVARELIKAAADVSAEALVVGTHEKSGAEKILLGSSSYKVAQRAPISVVIVK